MNPVLRLARHEWGLVLRDPRFLIPFGVAPLFLLVLHGGSLYLFPDDVRIRWMFTRSFLAILSLVGASMAVPLGADSFAGEKERQTWETLLCLPMSRKQLFAGKVLGILPFPLAVAWIGQTFALAFAAWRGNLQVAKSLDCLAPLLLTPFLTVFFCALSVLISLRCDTVRSAAQFTGVLLLVLFPAITFLSQTVLANPIVLISVLGGLSVGAVICFALATRRL